MSKNKLLFENECIDAMACSQMCKTVFSLQESHECLLNETLLLILPATVSTMTVAV